MCLPSHLSPCGLHLAYTTSGTRENNHGTGLVYTLIVQVAPWLSSCLVKSLMGLLHIVIIFVHRPHLLALFYAGEPPKQTISWWTQMDEWMVQTWSNSDNNSACPVPYLWVVLLHAFASLGGDKRTWWCHHYSAATTVMSSCALYGNSCCLAVIYSSGNVE